MLADELIALRCAGARRAFERDELPDDIGGAYRTAARALGLDGGRVAAWKLGATTAGTRKLFSTDTVYFGALTEAEVWIAGESPPHRPPPLFRAEAEIAFRLQKDVEIGSAGSIVADFDPEMIFDAWCPALEAPYSCIENMAEAGLVALLADRCAAGALFLSQPRADVLDPAIDEQFAIIVDGTMVAAGTAPAALLMSPMAAALDFLVRAGEAGMPLAKGQWISTGGITPCIDLPVDGRSITLRHAGRDQFALDLVI